MVIHVFLQFYLRMLEKGTQFKQIVFSSHVPSSFIVDKLMKFHKINPSYESLFTRACEDSKHPSGKTTVMCFIHP